MTTGRIMYTPHNWRIEVEAFEIVGETPKFVTVRGNGGETYRRSKANFYDTWEECRTAMVEEARRQMEGYQRMVHQYSTRMGQLKALKEPQP